MKDFKIGDIVQVRGDAMDFTEHLDGEIGVVIADNIDDCIVRFDTQFPITDWYIWKWNITHA